MSKNLCIVKIKSDRICCYCKRVIPSGTKCLTTNPRYGKRKWQCPTCTRLKRELARLKSEESLIPFDDEGAAWAYSDFIAEVSDELESRRRN